MDDDFIFALFKGWLWLAPLVLIGAACWRWRAEIGRLLASLAARKPEVSTESDGDRIVREAKAEYEKRLLQIDDSPMDDLERDAAKRQAKQTYLRRMDGGLR